MPQELQPYLEQILLDHGAYWHNGELAGVHDGLVHIYEAGKQDGRLLTCKGCDRRDALSDEHRAAILELIGDEALTKDNPSWERVIDAVLVRIGSAEDRLRSLLCTIHRDADGEYLDTVSTEQAVSEAIEQIARERRAYSEMRSKP